MNDKIVVKELSEVLKHLQQDEMRLERIISCLKLAIQHEEIMEKIETEKGKAYLSKILSAEEYKEQILNKTEAKGK